MARRTSLLSCFLLLLFATTNALKAPQSRVDRYLSKIYTDADANHDNKLNLDECYELVLRLYVQINQQAPIPPPSREKVKLFIERADTNHNHKINRTEFKALAKLLYGRAAVRLVAYKIVTLVGAPIAATYLARYLVNTHPEQLQALQEWLATRLPEKLGPSLTSPTVGRTALIVLFMATLGNLFLALVNATLDMYNLPPRSKK